MRAPLSPTSRTLRRLHHRVDAAPCCCTRYDSKLPRARACSSLRLRFTRPTAGDAASRIISSVRRSISSPHPARARRTWSNERAAIRHPSCPLALGPGILSDIIKRRLPHWARKTSRDGQGAGRRSRRWPRRVYPHPRGIPASGSSPPTRSSTPIERSH